MNKSDKSSSSKWQVKQNCTNIAVLVGDKDDNNSDLKSFKLDKVNMAKEKESNQQFFKGVWYLDSYTFWHLTNNRDLFIKDLCHKCLNFTTIGEQTFCTKSIKTITISLANRYSIRYKRLAYTPDYDSNLISLR